MSFNLYSPDNTAWNATSFYAPGAVVVYKRALYVAKKYVKKPRGHLPPPNPNPEQDSSSWGLFAPASLVWKGRFNPTTVYHPGDLVGANGLYTCTTDPVAVSESVADTFIRSDQAEWGDCSDGLHTWITYGSPDGTNTISDNKGLAVIDSFGSGELMFLGNVGDDRLDYSIPFTITDQEILVRWEVTESVDGNDGPNIVLNWASQQTGVQFSMKLNGDITIGGNVFTNNTLLGTWAGGVANQKYWSRCRYELGVASVVTWEDGTTEPESWDYSEQVQDLGGYVEPAQLSLQNFGDNNSTTVAFDSLSVHTVSPYPVPDLDRGHWERIT